MTQKPTAPFHSISGVLLDPYGDYMPGAIIRFKSLKNALTVLKDATAETTTDGEGYYALDLEYGLFEVEISLNGVVADVGEAWVSAKTTARTLNELIKDSFDQQTVNEDLFHRIKLLVEEGKKARDEAVKARDDAYASEVASESAARRAEIAAGSVADGVEKAAKWAEGTGEVEPGKYSAKTHAENAKLSETNAKDSETASTDAKDASELAAVNARVSMEAAYLSQQEAHAAKNESIAAKDNSERSAIASANNAGEAKTARDTALTKAGEATTAASNAKASETGAGTSERNAKSSESNAVNAESSAVKAKDAAAISAQEAKDAAAKVKDPFVDGGGWDARTPYPPKQNLSTRWYVTHDSTVHPIKWVKGDELVYNNKEDVFQRISGQGITPSPNPLPFEPPSDIVLKQSKALKGIDSSGTTHNLIQMDADDDVRAGCTGHRFGILTKAADQIFAVEVVGDPARQYQIFNEKFMPKPSENNTTETAGKGFVKLSDATDGNANDVNGEFAATPKAVALAMAEALGRVPKTRTINSKALDQDITLVASDLGAIEDCGYDGFYFREHGQWVPIKGSNITFGNGNGVKGLNPSGLDPKTLCRRIGGDVEIGDEEVTTYLKGLDGYEPCVRVGYRPTTTDYVIHHDGNKPEPPTPSHPEKADYYARSVIKKTNGEIIYSWQKAPNVDSVVASVNGRSPNAVGEVNVERLQDSVGNILIDWTGGGNTGRIFSWAMCLAQKHINRPLTLFCNKDDQWEIASSNSSGSQRSGRLVSEKTLDVSKPYKLTYDGKELIFEAPIDGLKYARRDGQWVTVVDPTAKTAERLVRVDGDKTIDVIDVAGNELVTVKNSNRFYIDYNGSKASCDWHVKLDNTALLKQHNWEIGDPRTVDRASKIEVDGLTGNVRFTRHQGSPAQPVTTDFTLDKGMDKDPYNPKQYGRKWNSTFKRYEWKEIESGGGGGLTKHNVSFGRRPPVFDYDKETSVTIKATGVDHTKIVSISLCLVSFYGISASTSTRTVLEFDTYSLFHTNAIPCVQSFRLYPNNSSGSATPLWVDAQAWASTNSGAITLKIKLVAHDKSKEQPMTLQGHSATLIVDG